jgi:hypothetical protein
VAAGGQAQVAVIASCGVNFDVYHRFDRHIIALETRGVCNHNHTAMTSRALRSRISMR